MGRSKAPPVARTAHGISAKEVSSYATTLDEIADLPRETLTRVQVEAWLRSWDAKMAQSPMGPVLKKYIGKDPMFASWYVREVLEKEFPSATVESIATFEIQVMERVGFEPRTAWTVALQVLQEARDELAQSLPEYAL